MLTCESVCIFTVNSRRDLRLCALTQHICKDNVEATTTDSETVQLVSLDFCILQSITCSWHTSFKLVWARAMLFITIHVLEERRDVYGHTWLDKQVKADMEMNSLAVFRDISSDRPWRYAKDATLPLTTWPHLLAAS